MERTDDESNKQPVILPPMIRIAYCTPSLHIPGGVERVLTTKANYLAENGNYDIYILLTDGKGKPPCYTLSPKVKIIQLVWGIERSGFFNGREKWAKGFENQRV